MKLLSKRMDRFRGPLSAIFCARGFAFLLHSVLEVVQRDPMI